MVDSNQPRIHCAGPSITEREIAYVTDAVTNCWYSDAGKYHQRLEAAVAEYLGVQHVVPTPTGTSAIHLAMMVLGIGPGDEVIVPELTWIGSAAPVSYVGARSVFADVDPDHWCLSAESLEAKITSRTRAVVVVDLYGDMPDYKRIREIADRCGIAVVEDAAQAFGSSWQGRKAGTFGDIGIFSLHGSKTVTSGEGGLFVTDRLDLYERALTLRDHGRRLDGTRFYEDFDRYYYHFELGNKFKMSSMQAALALAQVERAEELVTCKRQIHEWYCQELAEIPLYQIHTEREGLINSYWLPAVSIERGRQLDKLRVMRELEDCNIDIRPLYYPLSSLPPYCDTPSGHEAQQANRVAYDESPYGFNLPSNLRMTREDVVRVSAVLSRLSEEIVSTPTPTR
ncbi:DegT/DnrJ/EryC1/StrS family aminotransferase [Bythopirellula polymerisocia]|uniref:Putative pyridoxal phosphate-dependent aminotransferase EpsN n=1 Tax=Bythopirellula polymerisocia TaxID=2528003 RepID=A0A5C6C8J1_9BACT|nr:DegT/DnrJ/EryC1/StrS family aminotransferase [Bythopirellula polymerisocia]TWU20870.1 putative pyridoxal phosphate-dependent aminotransferase EpsN [Bythopirellula polymerisocia]